MAKEIELSGLSPLNQRRAREASALLLPHQHTTSCPVRQGASVSCVFPFVCCVFEDFEIIYSSQEDDTPQPKFSIGEQGTCSAVGEFTVVDIYESRTGKGFVYEITTEAGTPYVFGEDELLN